VYNMYIKSITALKANCRGLKQHQCKAAYAYLQIPSSGSAHTHLTGSVQRWARLATTSGTRRHVHSSPEIYPGSSP
jgi:hypothetical protein